MFIRLVEQIFVSWKIENTPQLTQGFLVKKFGLKSQRAILKDHKLVDDSSRTDI
mgnify:CR=1 FL=1